MFRFLTRITCHDRILRHGLHASRVCAVKGEAVKMPSLSPTMSEGTIVNWYKKEGDEIKAGDVLCDIQTDKAVVGFEVEEEGILAKILKPDNSLNVAVGSLIALMVEPGVDWKSVEMPEGTTTTTDKPEAVSAPTQVDTHQSSPRSIGPAVRNLLTAHGILPDDVTGTGPYGRLTKGDVLDFIKLKNLKAVEIKPEPVQKVAKVVEAPKQSVETAHYVDVAVSSMRATIAKRLSESKRSIPHAYATVDADLTALLAERQKLKAHGLNISVNNFVIKAVAESLVRYPNVNVLVKNEQAFVHPSVDVSVAVATDAGLITPIVFNASGKTVHQIGIEVKDLAARARENKLKPEEFQGGSFTVSNLGGFGVSEFTAIINLPQAAILAVGCNMAVLGADGKFRERMRSSLSYDARVISEVDAAEFLAYFQLCLETPRLLLRGSDARIEMYSN